jgi:hypothetical protein
VGSVAAADDRCYAVSGTGEVWAWGFDNECCIPLGHGEETECLLPKPIEALRGIKVDAVACSNLSTRWR